MVELAGGHWEGFYLMPFARLDIEFQLAVLLIAAMLVLVVHSKLRELAGRSVLRSLQRSEAPDRDRKATERAFGWNIKAWWSSLASASPRGWGPLQRRKLEKVLAEADDFVQSLNDQYASPSGTQDA